MCSVYPAEVIQAFRAARRQHTHCETDWTCKDDTIPEPDFGQALKELTGGNIDDYEVRRIEKAGKDKRRAAAQALAGDSARMMKWFDELFAAHDAYQKAQAGTDRELEDAFLKLTGGDEDQALVEFLKEKD